VIFLRTPRRKKPAGLVLPKMVQVSLSPFAIKSSANGHAASGVHFNHSKASALGKALKKGWWGVPYKGFLPSCLNG
jgi:hypothetical protein